MRPRSPARRFWFVADWEPSQRLLLRRAGDAEQQCGEAGIGLPRWLIFRVSSSNAPWDRIVFGER